MNKRLHRVAVAASGGRDSTALLHCTGRLARSLDVEVVALHVHHGLHTAADEWLASVRAQARRWGLGFESCRLQTVPQAGQSVEAWARRERYAALAMMAQESGCDIVLLAHHRRDQAETWLLQALRGGGAAGLSAMPARVERAGITWARPWLDMPRGTIEAYVRRHRLGHVDDSSNNDPRFARNRLRLQVWPALLAAFPDAETALTSATREAAQAAALADETAALDLPPLLRASGLAIEPWLALPPARRRNALAEWLRRGLPRVPHSLVERLCAELRPGRSARWPAPAAELRLYRGVLSVDKTSPAAAATLPLPLEMSVSLDSPGAFRISGWHGQLHVTPVGHAGVSPALLKSVVARGRQGGERFALAPGATARSLKKQFQARAVPAWARCGPLLFTPQAQLLFVPGLGVDASLWAAPDQLQYGLRWCPDVGGDQLRTHP
ncbi:MAG TPA: tRNA lysidine(34) synthetase TilS [Rubrivivax sp.]|nr:tRNA lysidine(34) synthetase TilS [Rubrivivax sp.]